MAAVEEESKNSASTDLIASFYGGMRSQKFEGFWIDVKVLPAVKVMQKDFQPRPDDIFLASCRKSGTTWSKALLHTIIQCSSNQQRDANLGVGVDNKNSHSLVPTMETYLFDSTADDHHYDLSIFSKFPSPRLLHTHLPFHLLPLSVRSSACKIVYIARNPRDVFVSLWKFLNKLHEDDRFPYLNGDLSKETVFDGFSSGFDHGGPFAENVLSYWHESRRDPNKVMFLTYEDLQDDCVGWVKKLGLFLGCSPQLVEENAAIIVEKCSFQSLSTLEVNKTGRVLENKYRIPNHSFFSEGKVGEWKKHFTPQMEERIYLAIEQKLNNEGLYFKYNL